MISSAVNSWPKRLWMLKLKNYLAENPQPQICKTMAFMTFLSLVWIDLKVSLKRLLQYFPRQRCSYILFTKSAIAFMQQVRIKKPLWLIWSPFTKQISNKQLKWHWMNWQPNGVINTRKAFVHGMRNGIYSVLSCSNTRKRFESWLTPPMWLKQSIVISGNWPKPGGLFRMKIACWNCSILAFNRLRKNDGFRDS